MLLLRKKGNEVNLKLLLLLPSLFSNFLKNILRTSSIIIANAWGNVIIFYYLSTSTLPLPPYFVILDYFSYSYGIWLPVLTKESLKEASMSDALYF